MNSSDDNDLAELKKQLRHVNNLIDSLSRFSIPRRDSEGSIISAEQRLELLESALDHSKIHTRKIVEKYRRSKACDDLIKLAIGLNDDDD